VINVARDLEREDSRRWLRVKMSRISDILSRNIETVFEVLTSNYCGLKVSAIWKSGLFKQVLSGSIDIILGECGVAFRLIQGILRSCPT